MTQKNDTPQLPSERETRLWNIGVVAMTLAGALLIVSMTAADPDLWGHVLFGLDLLRTGSLPATDPYSYTSGGHPWINHETLSEVAFGLAFKLGATPGLMLLKISLTFAIALLLHRHLRRAGLDRLKAGIVLILAVFTMMPALGTIRPQLFTHLFFLLTLLILVRAERDSPRWLWGLPVLFAIWINFHGGVLAGLGVVVLWAAAWTVVPWVLPARRSHGPRRALLVGVVAASFLALILNPYLWKLPVFLFETATVPRPDISEWQPLRITTVPGALYVLLLGIGIFVSMRSKRDRSPAILLVLLVTAVLPLVALRHLSLFALTFAVFLAEDIADVWAQRGQREPARAGPPGATRGARALIIGLNFFAVLIMVAASASRTACIPINESSSIALPTQAVGLVRQAGVEGNLAIFFDYGEFAIWHLKDRVRVSMDGRRETVYPDSAYGEALRFQAGVGAWDDVLDKRPTDMALVPHGLPTYNLLELKPGWSLAHSDSLVGLFVRDRWPGGELLLATPAPPLPATGEGLCFP